MRCSPLTQLPSPPSNKAGWPWTEESLQLPPQMPKGAEWPKISVVTPSYNQGRFIEGTIRSVLLQGYPNLEYIIIDGGSKDNSIEIIRKYEPWLTYWVSEPDNGQTHAINKGLRYATGEIFNWLNTDDQLLPGVLAQVAAHWSKYQVHIVSGEAHFIDVSTGKIFKHWSGEPPKTPKDFVFPMRTQMAQPATFLDSGMLREIGSFREDLHYTMDYEFYLRATAYYKAQLRTVRIPYRLATMLLHPDAKSAAQAEQFPIEWYKVLAEYSKRLPIKQSWPLRQFLRRSRLQQLIAKHQNSTNQLLSVAIRNPDVLLMRFFWGTVRQRVHNRLSSMSNL